MKKKSTHKVNVWTTGRSLSTCTKQKQTEGQHTNIIKEFISQLATAKTIDVQQPELLTTTGFLYIPVVNTYIYTYVYICDYIAAQSCVITHCLFNKIPP